MSPAGGYDHRLVSRRPGPRLRRGAVVSMKGSLLLCWKVPLWAASQGAPAVEAYPVDPGAERMDLTMAFVGTRAMFENAGFEAIGTTDAVASRMPRLVMRRDLAEASN